MALREEIFGLQPDSSVSFLNFIQWIAPGGLCRPRHGWIIVNVSGVMALWRSGASCAETLVVATDELRGDMMWRRGAPESHSAKSLHFVDQGAFVLHPRLRGLRDKAPSMGPEAACTIYSGAGGSRGWGAPPGDSYIRGTWPKVAICEVVNWKELWVLEEAPSHWQACVRRKLVPVRMDGATAVAYAYHGAGCSSQGTRLVREM